MVRSLLIPALFGLSMIAPLSASAEELLKGTITDVGVNHVVLKVKKVQHKVVVNDETVIQLDGKKAKLTDLKAGFKAAVTARKEGKLFLATKIDASSKSTAAVTEPVAIALAASTRVTGMIKKLGKKQLELAVAEKNANITIAVNDKTTVNIDGKPAAFSALKVGYTVVVRGEKKGDQVVASTIVATTVRR